MSASRHETQPMTDRRTFLCSAMATLLVPRDSVFAVNAGDPVATSAVDLPGSVDRDGRFPYFKSTLVPYRHVRVYERYSTYLSVMA
jgi:hypothetical protein